MRLFCFVALLLVVLSGCNTKPTSDPIRIGVNPWPGYLFLHLAEEQGFFDGNNVAVELIELSSNGDVALAYQRGQIDIATSTTIDLLTTSHLSEKRPQVFAICDFSNGADVILAHPAVASIGDLKGKRVAAESGALDMVHLILALETAGLSLEDIIHVPMSQAAMPEAWQAGTIDVAVTYPPNSIALQNLGAHAIFDTSLIPGTIVDVLMAEKEYIAKNRAEIGQLLKAMEQAVLFFDTNREKALSVMARRGGMSVDSLAASLQGLRIPSKEEQHSMLVDGTTLNNSINITIRALKLPDELAQFDWLYPDLVGNLLDKNKH